MTGRRFNGYLAQFAFVQVSSFMMVLGINLSFFFFAHLTLRTVGLRPSKLLKMNTGFRFAVIAFMLGATTSTMQNYWEGDHAAFKASLAVYPNYIYWGLMMMMMTCLAPSNVIVYRRLFKAITAAVSFSAIYYVFLENSMADNRFLKVFGPNNFSFLLICYAPYLVYYLRRRINPASAILVLAVLLILELKEGRRAGFLLVLLGGGGAYFVKQLRVYSIVGLLRVAVIAASGFAVLQLDFVEEQIRDQSPRVHRLIYSSREELLSQDRSYLVRKAMIEKGLVLFENNVFFGVGLNNFTRVYGQIEGNFEGAEFVVEKKIFNRVSSHNSYINILAEGGLMLAVPFAFIIGSLLLGAGTQFGRLDDPEKVIVVSFCLMLAHLYLTNAIVNSLAWFNIGLLAYVMSMKQYGDEARASWDGRDRAVAHVSLPTAGRYLGGGTPVVTARQSGSQDYQ